MTPTGPAGLARFREVVGGAFAAIVGRSAPAPREIESVDTPPAGPDATRAALFVPTVLRWGRFGEMVEVADYRPPAPASAVLLWVREDGNEFARDATPPTRRC